MPDGRTILGGAVSDAPAPSRPVRAVLATAACAACLALFFRGQIGDGFTLLLGDRHDAVIALSIMEHWANLLRGRAIAWDTTHYFHPVPATLGYNDGYLAFGLLHAAFRAAGADPLLSGELTNAALRAIGFAGFHLLGRRVLGLPFGWALLGAALFTLSNNLAIRASHAQLFSVSLVPTLAVLAHGALRALRDGRRAALLGWGAAFLAWHAMMLMTGFYMAWYAAFFGGALLVAWVGTAGRERRRRLMAATRGAFVPLLGLAALAALLNLPFLLLYLPKARETGMHGYAGMVAQYTLSPLDLLHVGEQNLLWGWLVRAVNGAVRPDLPAWSEQMTGLPPLLLLVFAAALAWLWRARRAAADDGAAMLRAVAVATLATWALTLRVGGASPWWLVYELVPGAKAARVVARYQIFIVVPVVALALALLAARARRFAAPIVGAVCVLLLAEQLNAYAPRLLDRPLELSRLEAVPPPPAGCRAFFVTAARTESRFGEEVANAYNHNTEAMLVAAVTGLPTINGLSTFNPPHWKPAFPGQPEYLDWVRRYAEAHGVEEGLCGLDLQRFAWDAAPLQRPDARTPPGRDTTAPDVQVPRVLPRGSGQNGGPARGTGTVRPARLRQCRPRRTRNDLPGSRSRRAARGAQNRTGRRLLTRSHRAPKDLSGRDRENSTPWTPSSSRPCGRRASSASCASSPR